MGIQKWELGLQPLVLGAHPVGGVMFLGLPHSGLPLHPGRNGLESGAGVQETD